MANDQNASHSRRPFHHRRRGPDRRHQDRHAQPSQASGGSREADVEQIMRDIRARISTKHGIELTRAQVQELAARRLDAILEPRHIKPELMEQLRRAAGERVQVPDIAVRETRPELDEAALYRSNNGLLNAIRRMLRPLLKLFIDPAPLVEAVNVDRRLTQSSAARESEIATRQAQWNALHYEILQRLVTDVARATIEVQNLSARLESLSAKLDFSERRVGDLEQALHAGRTVSRPQEVRQGEPPAEAPALVPGDATPEGARRRRRRRRARRPGLAAAGGAPGAEGEREDLDVPEGEAEGEDVVESAGLEEAPDAPLAETTTPLEPAHSFSLLQPVERHPAEPSGYAPPAPVEQPAEPGSVAGEHSAPEAPDRPAADEGPPTEK